MTSTLTIRYTQDPGHGWIHVKRDLAQRILGDDLAKISSFSYQRGATLYLEEDQDADLFLKAASRCGYAINLVSHHVNRHSPIRSYPPFSL